MKKLWQLFSLIIILALLTIPVWAQNTPGSFTASETKGSEVLPAVTFASPFHNAVPGESVEIKFWASSEQLSQLSLELYSFDIVAALQKQVAVDYASLTSQDFQELQFALTGGHILEFTAITALPEDNNELSADKVRLYKQSLPKLAGGVYLLKLTYKKDNVAESQDSFQIVSVSGLKMLCVNSGSASGLIWITDANSGNPVQADKVYFYSASEARKGQITSLHCTPDGLVNLPVMPKADRSVCVAFKDKEAAVLFISEFSNISKYWKAFLWCDSRSAAPGESLAYKAVVRSVGSCGTFSAASKEVFTVSLCTLQGDVVAENKASLDFSGALSGVVQLPPGLAREPYVLVLKDSQGGVVAEYGLASALSEYTDMNLKAEAAASLFSVGDIVPIDVSLTDGNGAPIADADVALNFSVCQANLAVNYEVGALGAEATSSFAASPKLAARKISTNLSGQAQVKFICPPIVNSGSQMAVVRVLASVRGSKGKLYRSACSFSVAAAPGFLNLNGPEEIKAGSPAQYFLQASDLSGAPIAGLQIGVSALSEAGHFEEVGKFTADSRGCCLFNWRPQVPGRYILQIRSLKDSKIRSVSSIEVTADDTDSFDLDLSSQFVEVGSFEEIKLYASAGVHKALLVLDREGQLSRFVVEVRQGKASFVLPIRKELTNSVRVMAFAWADGQLKKAEELISIRNPEQIFNLKVSFANHPVCGQPVDLHIEATDGSGRPLTGFADIRLIGPKDHLFLAGDNILATFCRPNSRRQSSYVFNQNEYTSHSTAEDSRAAHSMPVILYPENKCLSVAQVRTSLDRGAASCSVSMPAEEGYWKLSVVGITQDGRLAQTVLPFVLKKDVELAIVGPAAINRGDFAKYKLTMRNCTDRELKFNALVKAADTSVLLVQSGVSSEKSQEAGDMVLSPRAETSFSFMVKSGLPGSSSISAELKGNGISERFTRPVEVLPLATVYSQEASSLLQRQANLSLDRFRREFIGRVFDRRLHIEIMNGLAGVLASSVRHLSGSSDRNSEAVLSSWAAPVICSSPFIKHNLKIPSYFNLSPEQAQDNLLALRLAQNKDGGFSWCAGTASDPIYTAFTVRYLKVLREAGVGEIEPLINSSEAYLRQSSNNLKLGERLLLGVASSTSEIKNNDLSEAVKRADTLDNPSFVILVYCLDLAGRRNEAVQLWKKAAQRSHFAFISSSDKDGEKITSAHMSGERILSDCKTTALALMVNLRLEGDSSKSRAYLHWLLSNRCGQGWYTASDTIVALEAVSSYMYKFFEANRGFSYGIWINGNELESGNGLAEESNWHKLFVLNVAQLPDSPLNIKVIKNGSDLAWVHVHESLTVHGLPDEGYWEEASSKYINSPKEAPFFITNECRVNRSAKNEFQSAGDGLLGCLDDQAVIDVKLALKENGRYAVIELPYLGGFAISQVEGLEKLNGYFNKQANRIYITSLPKGEYIFRLKGKLIYQGEFTAKPALVRFLNSPLECAQGAPFTLFVGDKRS
ncbi:MAG: hypothetical protein ACI38Q_03970 [Candidatus Bruticola sp.]